MPTTAVTKKSPIDEAFALAPAHVKRVMSTPEMADRFLVVALNQMRRVPALATCSKESILDALVRMAQLGLDPSVPNEVYLIPFKQEASLIVGYGGLRKLVLRNADVLDVFTSVVCQNDTYHPADSPVSLPVHRLPEAFAPRGRAIGYYAAAYLRSGFWRVVCMSRAEVVGHRDRYSAGAKGTFWADNHADKEGLTNFDKMAMKTCLRQLCSPRHLSLDADVAEALQAEEGLYQSRERATIVRDAVPRHVGHLPMATLSEELYGPAVIMAPPTKGNAVVAQELRSEATVAHDEPPQEWRGGAATEEPSLVEPGRDLFAEEEAAEREPGQEG